MPAKKLITFNGETHSISEWERLIGLPHNTIYGRIVNDKCTIEQALRPRRTNKNGIKYGEGYVNRNGYRTVSINGNVVFEHVAIAENALGRKLQGLEEVHHVNYQRADNRNVNLVICPDRKYHALLHLRTDALNACGNPQFRRCKYCRSFDDTANMKEVARNQFMHLSCERKRGRERYQKKISEKGKQCQQKL